MSLFCQSRTAYFDKRVSALTTRATDSSRQDVPRRVRNSPVKLWWWRRSGRRCEPVYPSSLIFLTGHQRRAATFMSSQSRIHHLPAGSGPVYWGPGDEVTFMLTGAETGGAFCLAAVSVPPGGGPPPHIHDREDETLYLLQGALTVLVG